MSFNDIIKDTDLVGADLTGGTLAVFTPIDGSQLAKISQTRLLEMPQVISHAKTAFKEWRDIPAPTRGELVRLLGQELRQSKKALGKLVTLECGKTIQEGWGEVQEMIDICDFAVGLSRQLYGRTITSERAGHRMLETWHPMGVCGVISAFNFPVAVWCWNMAVALICGAPVIWKPSRKTPLCALACEKIFQRALRKFNEGPQHLLQVIIGERSMAEFLVESPDVAIISATGSTKMGRAVAPVVAARFGRSILELGGNNAMIVTAQADLDMAVRAAVFSAVGTCGQRCTSLRRLIVHRSVKDQLLARLKKAYATILIGDPLDQQNLMGPLIDLCAFKQMQAALSQAIREGGHVFGGQRIDRAGVYVQPCLVEMPAQSAVVQMETFAPILYVMEYETFQQAVDLQNGVSQGLSSCIFSTNIHETEKFISAVGSDCGIANVNIGPSGAEIGGAFGGEKETGGGREAGSDAWKNYMRRQTSTINYSDELPLAQGIVFDV